MFGKKKKSLSQILGVFESTAEELEDLIDDRKLEVLANQETIATLAEDNKVLMSEADQAGRALKNIRKIIE